MKTLIDLYLLVEKTSGVNQPEVIRVINALAKACVDPELEGAFMRKIARLEKASQNNQDGR